MRNGDGGVCRTGGRTTGPHGMPAPSFPSRPSLHPKAPRGFCPEAVGRLRGERGNREKEGWRSEAELRAAGRQTARNPATSRRGAPAAEAGVTGASPGGVVSAEDRAAFSGLGERSLELQARGQTWGVRPPDVHSAPGFHARLVVQGAVAEKGYFDANEVLGDAPSSDGQVTGWAGGVGLARPGPPWRPAPWAQGR